MSKCDSCRNGVRLVGPEGRRGAIVCGCRNGDVLARLWREAKIHPRSCPLCEGSMGSNLDGGRWGSAWAWCLRCSMGCEWAYRWIHHPRATKLANNVIPTDPRESISYACSDCGSLIFTGQGRCIECEQRALVPIFGNGEHRPAALNKTSDNPAPAGEHQIGLAPEQHQGGMSPQDLADTWKRYKLAAGAERAITLLGEADGRAPSLDWMRRAREALHLLMKGMGGDGR